LHGNGVGEISIALSIPLSIPLHGNDNGTGKDVMCCFVYLNLFKKLNKLFTYTSN